MSFVKTYDDFEERFKPIARADSSLLWDWQEIPKPIDSKKWWTVLDCDGRLYLSAGLHYVNRLGYVQCEVEWTAADLTQEYFYDEGETEEGEAVA